MTTGSGHATRPGPSNSLVDVAGLRVGHAGRHHDGWLTGTTVVLAPAGGMVGGVDVRGGGPGTRETDLLDPRNVVDRVHAVTLTGGSAFGLATADGVMRGLFADGVGFPVGEEPAEVVPIVPAAVIFDLGRGGRFGNVPDAAMGLAAYRDARDDGARPVEIGCVGAGLGAVAGGLKGGVGTASAALPGGATVAALVVVNALGSTVDPRTGAFWGAPFLVDADAPGLRPPSMADVQAAPARLSAGSQQQLRPGTATTIGVVATDYALTKAQCSKLAGIGHDGLARAISPVHSMLDGDSLFGLSTASRPAPDLAELQVLLELAAHCVTRSVVRAMISAANVTGATRGCPTYSEVFPSAVLRRKLGG